MVRFHGRQQIAGFTGRPIAVVDGALTVPPARPATLAQLHAAGTHFQVGPPASGIRPTSGPQHAALAVAASRGYIVRGGKPGQASVRTLTALARRGLVTLVAEPGTRKSKWSFGRITPAGRRELARLDAEQEQRRRHVAARDAAIAAASG